MNIFDKLDVDPKLLISDSLKESFLEDKIDEINDAFITVVIVTDPETFSIMGNLVGVDFGNNIQLDIKISLKEAFSFIGNALLNKQNKKLKSLILAYNAETINVQGPYTITSTKIIEIDVINKLCILAIDLIKDIT